MGNCICICGARRAHAPPNLLERDESPLSGGEDGEADRTEKAPIPGGEIRDLYLDRREEIGGEPLEKPNCRLTEYAGIPAGGGENTQEH